jgi:hypothetical protein
MTFRKLDLFPSSGEGGKTPTLLSHLERANVNHWSVIHHRQNPLESIYDDHHHSMDAKHCLFVKMINKRERNILGEGSGESELTENWEITQESWSGTAYYSKMVGMVETYDQNGSNKGEN